LARFDKLGHLIRPTLSGFPLARGRTPSPSYWTAKKGAGISRLPKAMSHLEKPPENKQTSYLSAGISALSPWSSRSASPKSEQDALPPSEPPLAATKGGDHTVSHKHRLSLRKYPRDCPPLSVQWFHAVDVCFKTLRRLVLLSVIDDETHQKNIPTHV
jgi:hypothetical protein